MSFAVPYSLQEAPPAELLAELDAAAAARDELTARAARLTFALVEQARGLSSEEVGCRPLTPAQLFDLLTGTS